MTCNSAGGRMPPGIGGGISGATRMPHFMTDPGVVWDAACGQECCSCHYEFGVSMVGRGGAAYNVRHILIS